MKKILFVNQDIYPYVEETELSKLGRYVPQKVQESGYEIRTFMPRWGTINERRGQLHEVIRLSGINISINDNDHPLIIKVASIAGSKVQVYFIDNEEFFSRRGQISDASGNMYDDNGERSIFFVRGVLETIKKLRWTPEIIHCHGWMSALVALYAKEAYKDELGMESIKVVLTLCDQPAQEFLQKDMKDCIVFNNINKQLLAKYNDDMSSYDMEKIAIDFSDGIIITSDNVNAEILQYVKESGKPVLECKDEEFAQAYSDFYESLF